MLEGAFSFRGRIGRLNYFLAGLLMAPAVVVAIIMVFVLMAMAQRSVASLVFFAILGALMVIVALWYSLSLQVRRIRDIGWDPVVVLVAWIAVDIFDAVLAAKMPGLALGHGQHGTAFGALVNLGLSLALWFWPGREPGDIAGVFGDDPPTRPSRLAALIADAPAQSEPMPAALPMRPGVRREFGRRGVR